MANTAVNNSAISNVDDYITLSVTINKNYRPRLETK